MRITFLLKEMTNTDVGEESMTINKYGIQLSTGDIVIVSYIVMFLRLGLLNLKMTSFYLRFSLLTHSACVQIHKKYCIIKIQVTSFGNVQKKKNCNTSIRTNQNVEL